MFFYKVFRHYHIYQMNKILINFAVFINKVFKKCISSLIQGLALLGGPEELLGGTRLPG